MAAAQTGASMPADGIQLVYEQNRWRVLFRRSKSIAHARSANADEHLHKFRTGNMKKRYAGLPGCGSRQKRLASSRRAHKQNAARNFRSDIQKFLWMFEKVNDFFELFFGFFQSGDIGKCHFFSGSRHFRLSLYKRKRLHGAALGLTQHEPD